jgi:peroxiredoxin
VNLSKAGIGVLGSLVGLGYWFGYQLLVQHGHLLLRLEALEQQWHQLPAALSIHGLPVGTVVHDFDLPTVAGGRMTLSQWRGRRLLLIFVGPDCGFSRALLRDLAALPTDVVDGAPHPLLVSGGDAEANRRLVRETGGQWPVLLQEEAELAALYHVDSTPMAYLIDEQGATASELVAGARAVLELASPASSGSVSPKGDAQLSTRPLARSRLNRDGLPAGTSAPGFRLPLLAGGEVVLEHYLGRPVLLIFSDPMCGSCDRVAPALERLHRRVPGLQMLMISRGDPDANRTKIDEHRLTFPVALQRHWEISRAYGMFVTPIAYLIDERGVIAADVAVGAEAIRGLIARHEFEERRRTQTKEVMRQS